MPLHGSYEQEKAHYYFDIDEINARKTDIPENILELEKRIEEAEENLKFIEIIYDELEDSNSYHKEFILEDIKLFENENDELAIFEESEYYIFHLDEYYIETAEGNERNWIYAVELEKEYERLEKYIYDLKSHLNQKILNIGIEIALLGRM
jgi:hypothetical protein